VARVAWPAQHPVLDAAFGIITQLCAVPAFSHACGGAAFCLSSDSNPARQPPSTSTRSLSTAQCFSITARPTAPMLIVSFVRSCVPWLALRLLKLPERVQPKCKPEWPRFAPKSLNSWLRGANCNPYFCSATSDVARVCSPHTYSPGRNHGLDFVLAAAIATSQDCQESTTCGFPSATGFSATNCQTLALHWCDGIRY
jgi:hypothetical protein